MTISIIGVGNVGSSIAHSIIINKLTDHLVLYDIDSNRLWAEAMELSHCVSILGEISVVTTNKCEKCFEADLVILAASEKYKNGMDRKDFSTSSAKICAGMFEYLNSFKGVFIIVTNPMDVMTYLFCKKTSLNWNRLMGTGTILDYYRLKTKLSNPAKLAWCIGEHGGSLFVPKSLSVKKNSVEIQSAIEFNNRISNRIMEIKGMTNWGITEAAICLIDTIVNDRKKVLPVSHMLQLSFLKNDICIGYPASIGKDGIECNEDIVFDENETTILKSICDKQQNHYKILEKVI